MREMAPCVSRIYLNEGVSRVSLNGGMHAFPVLTMIKLLTFISSCVANERWILNHLLVANIM